MQQHISLPLIPSHVAVVLTCPALVFHTPPLLFCSASITPTIRAANVPTGSGGDATNTAIIAGAAAGGAVVLLVAGLAAAFLCRKRGSSVGGSGPRQKRIPADAVSERNGQLIVDAGGASGAAAGGASGAAAGGGGDVEGGAVPM